MVTVFNKYFETSKLDNFHLVINDIYLAIAKMFNSDEIKLHILPFW